jgi:proteasome lid subunit RPN8/RPN11
MKLHDFPRQIIESFQVSQPILLHQQTLVEMLQHAHDGIPDEVAGHLIGFPVNTPDGANGLYIERAVRGICEASRTHFILRPESFKRTNALCKETNTILVGYYHSHPGHGIFLSPTDLDNFSDHYAKPYNVAVVLDPTKEMMLGTPGIGFFGWGKDGTPKHSKFTG